MPIGNVNTYQPFPQQAPFHRSQSRVRLVLGGNRSSKCVTIDTVIDTLAGKRTIAQLLDAGEPFKVWAWDGEKRVEAAASVPFKKPGLHQCYRVTMADGQWCQVADAHRLLTDGGWRYFDELLPTFGLASPERTSAFVVLGGNRIVSVETIAAQEVYDFTVEKYHNYIAADLVHHNTSTGVMEDSWCALGFHPYRKMPVPNHGWIVSLDHVMSEQVIEPLIWEVIPKDFIKDWEPRKRIFTLFNGSTIGLKSCDSGFEKFGGTSRNWVHFDESPDPEVYREGMMRTLDCHGDVWLTMTPTHGTDDWTYEKMYLPYLSGDIQPPELEIFEMSTEGNLSIDPAEIARISRGLSEWERKVRLFGQYATPEGVVLPEFSEKKHVVDDWVLAESPPSADWPQVIGMDFGSGNHATAAYWLTKNPRIGIIDCRGEYYEPKGLAILMHAQKIRQRFKMDYGLPLIRLDRTAQQVRLELNGVPGIRVALSDSDRTSGISTIRELLAEDANGNVGIRFARSCRHLIQDLQRYRFGTSGRGAGRTADGILKVNDDTVDALRYGLKDPNMQRKLILRLPMLGLNAEQREAHRMSAMFAKLKRGERSIRDNWSDFA